ncbi:restriction endonuclease [Lacticaseibacillus chiayiensis]|uniref:Restriction endonuclease n=1 Tax=Lacticaseibacillus chiayiensis TaxID=2100821 RepID=A0A4Q1UFM6_9LACO|nr:restriction endonuclease [Lacticaseibacillus chiayiensis]QVI33753.1 restriction endonuclease [Lacticaseibacillus chiayiensis]RXT29688.1 restriction endonuclease [Lacticaseibacillus chiayiensis]RXT55296.1 restriction endonuclease [Lacticaseibacillus chiayiensis]UYN55498.1 restriction endonuclease [Lacticaseibacillus chiayiensis]
MKTLLKKAYQLLWVLFILALAYSFWARDILPQQLRPYGDPASFVIISLFVVVNAIWLYHHHFRFRDLKMENVDIMEGEKFEEFCAYLLKRNGFKHIQLTQASGDQGIDIIARKKGQSIGFQCKRYTGFVGNKAVQEVWAGHQFYKLDQAAVITNSDFSDSAIALADDLGVMLIDRKKLKRLMRRLPS